MVGEILRWWLAVEVIGLVALPLAYVIFHRLPDRGYAFAKPAGILLVGYLFWLALTFHILPNRPGSIVWCMLALSLVSGWLYWTRREQMMADLRERLHVVVAVEVIFTLGLFGAAFLRSFIPEIDGTEKPMDFMFLNAASRSEFYPPDDPWFAGLDVSYYYFGYVLHAMLGKLSAAPTAVAFNLGVAGTAALAMTAAFGVGHNLVVMGRNVKPSLAIATGVAAAALLAVLGNLEGVLEFAKANNLASAGFFERFGVANLAAAPESSTWYPTDRDSFWWWWRATRMCPEANCIMEFPFFSFLLGDLHPHVMALPFVLTAVGLGLAMWRSPSELGFDTWRSNPALLLVTAVLVGGLGFLNTWDLPTFGSLLVLIVLARNLRISRGWTQAVPLTVGYVLPLAALAGLLYVPFYAGFSSQPMGLDAVSDGATRPITGAMFWLPLLILALPLPLVRVLQDPASRTSFRISQVVTVPAVLLLLWVIVLTVQGTSVPDAFTARGWNWLSSLFIAAGFCLTALALWRAAETSNDGDDAPGLVPMLAMTAVATMLILGAELFYIDDIFNSRLNTVFKLYYQAWILLAAAGAYGGYWLLRHWQTERGSGMEMVRGAWGGVATLALLGAMLYPLGATLSRTEELARPNRTLNGLAFVAQRTPAEVEAVTWVRTRAGQTEFIVEAVLGAYSGGARISGRSGVPAVIGWPSHEEQWGRTREEVQARVSDVDLAYTTQSLAQALEILRRYKVTYVVVGSVERAKYPAEGLQKFNSGLQSVYRNGDIVIYRMPALPAGSQTDATGAAP